MFKITVTSFLLILAMCSSTPMAHANQSLSAPLQSLIDRQVMSTLQTQSAVQSQGQLLALEQIGQGNSFYSLQQGFGNRIYAVQHGRGHSAVISQVGTDNVIQLAQYGEAKGIMVQQLGHQTLVQIEQY
ncbi:MAG: hypothetical protein JJU03_00550 [Idiomarina sp.]|nr:hypothetical protein [Idiomarina sp.]